MPQTAWYADIICPYCGYVDPESDELIIEKAKTICFECKK